MPMHDQIFVAQAVIRLVYIMIARQQHDKGLTDRLFCLNVVLTKSSAALTELKHE